MTLLIDEATVSELVTVDDALTAVTEGFAARGAGRLPNLPRVRLRHDDGTVRITAAVAEERGYVGVKISSSAVFGSNAGRVLNLFEADSGRLCAVIQVFRLGALRTAAVSGLATDLLASRTAESLAIIGTGRQARTQLDAVARVRPIRAVSVFGRDPARREAFARFAADRGHSVEQHSTSRGAVEGADIVVTATSASDPVLFGEWLDRGVHVNAVGANDESRRELDRSVVERAELVVTDEPAQARYEAADLMEPVDAGVLGWSDVRGLDEVLTDPRLRRSGDDAITLFKSLGTAIGDVVLASEVYERARARGLGREIPDLTGSVS